MDEQLNYNDLHYQYVGFKRSNSDLGNSEERAFVVETEPIEERELDHNQLAELVYMRRHQFLDVEITGTLIDQTETGGMEGVSTFEINSGEAEWLNSDQRPTQFVEENNRNIDLCHTAVQVPFNEQADQGGGGGGSSGSNFDTREVVFAGDVGIFDHGPVIDANDLLTFRFEIANYNTTYEARLKVYYVMGWRVHEVENARPEFGIPL